MADSEGDGGAGVPVTEGNREGEEVKDGTTDTAPVTPLAPRAPPSLRLLGPLPPPVLAPLRLPSMVVSLPSPPASEDKK